VNRGAGVNGDEGANGAVTSAPPPAARAAELLQAGQAEAARAILTRLVAETPDNAFAWSNLGSAERRLGDLQAALAAMRRATALAPEQPDLHHNLGILCADTGDHRGAADAFRRALALRPDDSRTWNRLGLALSRLPDTGGALRLALAGPAFRRALLLDGGFAAAWRNLASLYQQEGDLHLALTCLRQALAAAPQDAGTRNSLGIVLRDLGRVPEALRMFADAVSILPDFTAAQINLLFSLDFDAAQDTASQTAARKAWGAGMARPDTVPSVPSQAGPAPDPERKLRVGYVSAEFNFHSAATAFAAPILHHDPDRFHVLCYSTRDWSDAFTRRFRAAAEDWRQVDGWSDQDIAAQVVRDRVDILVDLAGCTPAFRPGLFARKPAPLQATGWGHATGTGMAQMDALLADAMVIPPQEAPLFAERVMALPCAASYTPFDTLPPATPAGGLEVWRRRQGLDDGLTFGALGRSAKLGPEAVRIWAQVLHAVSGSRLFLKDPTYRTRLRRRDIALAFAARGIDPSRLRFAGGTDWEGHLRAYWEVDIALDTIPHAGGVTTLESLLMGVPVVSLYGRFPSARIGASILTACDAANWVARDAAGFVAIARHLAARLDRLRAGRTTMRAEISAQTPYQPEAYARAVEGAYRSLWRDWCARQAGQSGRTGAKG